MKLGHAYVLFLFLSNINDCKKGTFLGQQSSKTVGHHIIKPKDKTDSKLILCEKILELGTIFPHPHNSFFANLSVCKVTW